MYQLPILYIIMFSVPHILSFYICLLMVIFSLKFTERSHMRERSRLFGKYIRNCMSNKSIIDRILSPIVLQQILVIIDMICGFFEGLEGHEQLIILTIMKETESQTDDIINNINNYDNTNNINIQTYNTEPETDTGTDTDINACVNMYFNVNTNTDINSDVSSDVVTINNKLQNIPPNMFHTYYKSQTDNSLNMVSTDDHSDDQTFIKQSLIINNIKKNLNKKNINCRIIDLSDDDMNYNENNIENNIESPNIYPIDDKTNRFIETETPKNDINITKCNNSTKIIDSDKISANAKILLGKKINRIRINLKKSN